MKATVLLLNRDMGTGHSPTIVQTWLGKKVGVSKYDPRYNCHSCELTLEDYEKHAKSLMQAAHVALRRWEPHFVVEDEAPKDWSYDGHIWFNDTALLRERAEAIEAWENGEPVEKWTGSEWLPLESQTAFFFDRRYRKAVNKPEVLVDVAETGSAWNNGDGVLHSEITIKTHHLTLKKIAREEGVDISGCATPQEKVDAILANRQKLQPA